MSTTIVDRCPMCQESDLGDRWCRGRKLQQYCRDAYCGWEGPVRVPEDQQIVTTKYVSVNQFAGFCYELYDRYGHVMVLSKSFPREEDCMVVAQAELDRCNADPECKPCTAVIWPATIKVKGRVLR